MKKIMKVIFLILFFSHANITFSSTEDGIRQFNSVVGDNIFYKTGYHAKYTTDSELEKKFTEATQLGWRYNGEWKSFPAIATSGRPESVLTGIRNKAIAYRNGDISSIIAVCDKSDTDDGESDAYFAGTYNQAGRVYKTTGVSVDIFDGGDNDNDYKEVYCGHYDFGAPWTVAGNQESDSNWSNTQKTIYTITVDVGGSKASGLDYLDSNNQKHAIYSDHGTSQEPGNCTYKPGGLGYDAGTGWGKEGISTGERQGNVIVRICNEDLAGNSTNNHDLRSWKIDLYAPATPTIVSTGNTHPEDTWVSDSNGTFTVQLNDTGTTGTTGPSPNTTYYCIDTTDSCLPGYGGVAQGSLTNLEFNTNNHSISFNLPDGEYYFRARVNDTGGGSATDSYKFKIDTTPPSFTIGGITVPVGAGPHSLISLGTGGWTSDLTDVVIELDNIQDSMSGLVSSRTRWERSTNMSACTSGTSYGNVNNASTTIPSQGEYYHAACTEDTTGNTKEAYSGVYQYDNTVASIPVITSSHTENSWNTTGTVDFTIETSDVFAYTTTGGSGTTGPSPYNIEYCLKKGSECTGIDTWTTLASGQDTFNVTNTLADGEWYMSARVNEPSFGTAHLSGTETYMFLIDTQFPTTDANPADRTSWANANTSLDINLTTVDPVKDSSNSGLAESKYVVTFDGTLTDATNSCTVGTTFNGSTIHNDMAEGTSWIHICTRDTAGNLTTQRWGLYLVDLTGPEITDDYTSDAVWVNTDQTITLTATDAHSGIKNLSYCTGIGCTNFSIIGGNTSSTAQTGITRTLSYSADTEDIIRYRTEDWAGNFSSISEIDIRIEDNDPTVPTFSYLNGWDNNGQHNSDTTTSISNRTISYSAADTREAIEGNLRTVILQRSECTNNGTCTPSGTWTDVQSDIDIDQATLSRTYFEDPFVNGISYMYRVNVLDWAGNTHIETSTDILRLDDEDPTIDDNYANDNIWMNSSQTFGFTNINDNYSGIDERRYCTVDYGNAACNPFPVGTMIPASNSLTYNPDTNSTIYYATRDDALNFTTNSGQGEAIKQIDVLIENDHPTGETVYQDIWTNGVNSQDLQVSFWAQDDLPGELTQSNIQNLTLEKRSTTITANNGDIVPFTNSWAPVSGYDLDYSTGIVGSTINPIRSFVYDIRTFQDPTLGYIYSETFTNRTAHQYRVYVQDVAGNESWIYLTTGGLEAINDTVGLPVTTLATLKMEDEESSVTFSNEDTNISINGWTNVTAQEIEMDFSDTGGSLLSSYTLQVFDATDNNTFSTLNSVKTAGSTTATWNGLSPNGIWSDVPGHVDATIGGVGATPSHTFTGVNNHAYTFRVQITDNAGNTTPWKYSIDDVVPIKIDTIVPTEADVTDNGASATPLLATDTQNFVYDIVRNGGAPITEALGNFEDYNTLNSFLGASDNSTTDLDNTNADSINVEHNIQNVDKSRTAGGYREYTYRVISITDEAGNTTNLTTTPALDSQYDYEVYANTSGVIPGANITTRLLEGIDNVNGTGIYADGSDDILTAGLTDQYNNAIVKATGIGRTVNFDIQFSSDSSVYLDQYLRSGDQAVYLTTDKSGGAKVFTDFSTNPSYLQDLDFESGRTVDGKYDFNFQVYAPTASSYTSSISVSDSDAKFEIENILFSIEHGSSYSSWDTGDLPLDGATNIDFTHGPLYETSIGGEIELYGFIEGAIQSSTIGMTKISTSSTSNERIWIEFGPATISDLNLNVSSDGSIPSDLLTNGIYRNFEDVDTSSDIILDTLLNMNQGSTIEELQSSYFSTHIEYVLDGNTIVINTDITGRDNYFAVASSTASSSGNTTQAGIKVLGQTHSANQKDLITDQADENIQVLGDLYKASLKKEIVRNAYTIIRNSDTSSGISTNPKVGNLTDFTSSSNDGSSFYDNEVLYFWNDGDGEDANVEITGSQITGNKTILAYGRNIYINNDMYYDDKESDILGIIALKDENGYGGNVYIDPNITNVVGTIFAERSLISSEDGVNELNGNTSQTILRNQLHIYGSIFSENSIGGSRETTPVCPYYINSVCTRELAQIYDMNYLRRYFIYDTGTIKMPANNGKIIGGGTCNDFTGNNCTNGSDYNANFNRVITESNTDTYAKYPVVVEYNSNVQGNPAPLFEIGN